MVSSAVKTFKDTFENDVVNEKTCKRWFSVGGFKKDDFSLKDGLRAGCSRKLNSEKFQVAIGENPTCTTREFSETFNVAAVGPYYREMKRLGLESLKGWQMGPLLHTICQKSTSNSVTCCVSLRSRELQAPFSDRIITDSDGK
ncbi:unnamed protein product [Hymenolepis diminuta]|uniref:Mos1 transposase HTH domain-containing protein n=1 Tax=Hymenolepis diminuta TaxID=6216 RepID=A0A564YJ34_HYMDI|nr:unnamed protein product [Hymenolepis diminuta]